MSCFSFSHSVDKCAKCAENARCEQGRCVCNDGYLETAEKRCEVEPGGGWYHQYQGVTKVVNEGEEIFIYSCSARRILFEISYY